MIEQQSLSGEDVRSRLLDAAKAHVLSGDSKFSIGTLCGEAGVDRMDFRNHFSGKTQLMAALMQEKAPRAPAEEIEAQDAPLSPKAEAEPSVSAPDAWLERRLRVFERALNALEAKAEATARDHARRIAALEERLAQLDQIQHERRLDPRPVTAPQAMPAQAAPAVADKPIAVAEEPEPETGKAEAEEAVPAVLEVKSLPVMTPSKQEMADVLQSARDKVRAAAAGNETPKTDGSRLKWLAIGGLSLVVLFLCIGLTLGNTAGAHDGLLNEWQGSGVSRRHVAQGELARTIALADAGDTRAEAKLALDYLRGQGLAADPQAALRWSAAAAKAGQPVAEYLLGALYQQGGPVKADPTRAFQWFAAAAARGNLKAMHNLAIAYAEGQGTAKDPVKAAQWFASAALRGYVDSAFDLAVLYERGEGVPQDARAALKWYGVAARAGDAPSKLRLEFLKSQMTPDAVQLALNAAQDFQPLPPLAEANRL